MVQRFPTGELGFALPCWRLCTNPRAIACCAEHLQYFATGGQLRSNNDRGLMTDDYIYRESLYYLYYVKYYDKILPIPGRRTAPEKWRVMRRLCSGVTWALLWNSFARPCRESLCLAPTHRCQADTARTAYLDVLSSAVLGSADGYPRKPS